MPAAAAAETWHPCAVWIKACLCCLAATRRLQQINEPASPDVGVQHASAYRGPGAVHALAAATITSSNRPGRVPQTLANAEGTTHI